MPSTEVIVIAAVMIGAALVLRMFLDARDRNRRAEEMARMRGDRVASVSLTPTYADPLAVFRNAEAEGQTKYLRDGFFYIGAMDMAAKLQRLPAPEPPKVATPPSPTPPPGQ